MPSQVLIASLLLFLVPLPNPLARGGEGERDELQEAPIAKALAAASEDVRVFNDHVVTLSSPFMEGRLPGTHGMEVAKDYVEFWMRAAGLEPAFPDSEGASDYRQPFPLAGISHLKEQYLGISGSEDFSAGEDYTALSLGTAGEVGGNAVFVGYSLEEGEDGYSSYAPGDDLKGKVAVMFRFEPMDENGKSLWGEDGWSARASFGGKIRAAAKRGAAGILIINPPGAFDPRGNVLPPFNMGGQSAGVPVFLASPDVAAAVFAGSGSSVMDMRRHADEGGEIVEFPVDVTLACEIDRQTTIAENVGGLLRGRGALANEYVVVGAHMDHLGMGYFGSRDPDSAGRVLHPGADDNASGTAGILLIADWMAQDYAAAPEDASLRSVLFLAFSAEESGLNGARHYVENPIADISQHALMMNFDMIGRITNRRLGVFGVGSAKGMSDWMEPIFKASSLDVQAAPTAGGGSDHLAFIQKGVPSLFAIIADFHEDYHTPLDTSDKINRVDGVEAAYLWRDIARVAVARSERFEFVEQGSAGFRFGGGSGAGNGGRAGIKVRFGIRPDNVAGEGAGVVVAAITPGGSAEEGGIHEGDRLVRWNGEEISDIRAWMDMLRDQQAGDEVKVSVERDKAILELTVTLQASDG